MKKLAGMVGLAMFFSLFFCTDFSQALVTDVGGRIQSTFVLRDTNGFQYDFLDETEGVQWRNELKFELTIRPEYEELHTFRLDKIFLGFRGAYDAIFDTRDGYEDVREKSPADFELGLDDIEYESDLREAFTDLIAEGERHRVILRLGRQIVQWGEADGFNVVNIINPQDNSTLMFFENIDDLATPLWMARLSCSLRSIGPFRDLSFQGVVIPDIRPHQFAPLDDNMDAPYAFGFKHLKGKDIAYFHKLSSDFGFTAMGMDLGSINDLEGAMAGPLGGMFGITDPITKWKEDVPAREVDNMEYGARLQGSSGGFVGALYYFHGYQDDPAMDFSELVSSQKLTFRHPEQDMFGASFNLFVPSVNAVLRGEGCLISKQGIVDFSGVTGGTEAFTGPNLPPGYELGAKGYVLKKVWHTLIGLDKDLWMRWLNPKCMIHTSWQGYWRHIEGWDHDSIYRPFDEADNFRITGFFWSDFWNGRIHPEIFVMYDPENTWMTMTSVKYTKDGKLFYKITQMSFWGDSDAISPFTEPIDLTRTSEISFRVGYNW